MKFTIVVSDNKQKCVLIETLNLNMVFKIQVNITSL